MNLIHKYYINNEIFYNSNPLQSAVKFGIISPQSEKVIASRGKLNYLPEANDSTPLNRAFFVRNIRTPKEYADFVFNLNPIILSMVERNGPSLTGSFPPCYALPPDRGKSSGSSYKSTKGHRRNDLQISLRQSHTSAF